MSKSRSKSRSEVEFLRGEVRRLKSELKYYKRHAQIPEIDSLVENEDLKQVKVESCLSCGKGALIEYDFYYAKIKKCDICGITERKSKK